MNFNQHLDEIMNGGLPVLTSKLRNYFFTHFWSFVSTPIAVPTIILIRCLKPWRLIKFGSLPYSRIGHFTADTGQEWAIQCSKNKKDLVIYWLPSDTCNSFWSEMVKRNFKVYGFARCLQFWNERIPGGDVHKYNPGQKGSRDIQGHLEKTEANLPFFSTEDNQAEAWLSGMGWKKGEPFVCLLVRDSAYLNKQSHIKNRRDWRYHDYRNSDIDSYVPACEWLADQGVWVLRMGKIMAKPFRSNRPRIIDYAFHPDKSDFLDIWLFAHCTFCISTGSGPDAISDIYRRPMLFVNLLPISQLVSWSDAIHFPKYLIWKTSGKHLSFKEYLEKTFLHTQKYEEAGIEIIDLTADDILHAVKERWIRLQGKWVDSGEDNELQERFWEIFKSWPKFSKYHGYIHPESRIGTHFLRNNPEFLQ
ncbi:MAG: TIGR04372 family glycosyltransferase [Desulfamplus sp.]|nr:TIGR04372 family glycosyltransferase [Desulfamplus sp.]